MKGKHNRGVAQLASASGLGPEGPVFESQYPDIQRLIFGSAFFCIITIIFGSYLLFLSDKSMKKVVFVLLNMKNTVKSTKWAIFVLLKTSEG